MTRWIGAAAVALAVCLPVLRLDASTLMGKLQIQPDLMPVKAAAATWSIRMRVADVVSDEQISPVIFLTGLPLDEEAAPPAQTVTVTINRYGLTPIHAWVTLKGDIELVNEEKDTPLTVVIAARDVQAVTTVVEPQKTVKHRFTKVGSYVIKLKSRQEEAIHILVLDNAYIATVDRTTYRFLDVPPGNAEVIMWYCGDELYREKVEIPEEGLKTLNIDVNEVNINDIEVPSDKGAATPGAGGP
jgi:hypothetical protein